LRGCDDCDVAWWLEGQVQAKGFVELSHHVGGNAPKAATDALHGN
jgi:hypothetical protein